jgi:hypothetical protein
MKLWTAEEFERKREVRSAARRGPKLPKCACGCGKGARWPQGSKEPVFYTRLCGYLMALKMVRRKAKAK